MRRIVGTAFVSLDGVMPAPGGPSEDPTGGFDKAAGKFKFLDPAADEALGKAFDGYDLLCEARVRSAIRAIRGLACVAFGWVIRGQNVL